MRDSGGSGTLAACPVRTILTGALLAGGAALCGVGAAAAAPQLPRCHTSGLSASLGRIDAGAGQRDVRLTLRNRSGHSCRTQGWIGMQLRRSGSGSPQEHRTIMATSTARATV